MSTLDEVKKIILEKADCKSEDITESANLIEDLGLDSLDAVELIMEFEEKFAIQIPDEEAEKIKTVKDLLDCIEKKKS